MKGHLKRASEIIHKYIRPDEIELGQLQENVEEWVPKSYKKKKKPKNPILLEFEEEK